MGKNWESKEEILQFARKLEGQTLNNVEKPYALVSAQNHKGKGALGQFVENIYFGIETNSRPEADFHPIQLELKTTGLLKDKKGNLVPKERLSLGMIDFNELASEEFETSHLVRKNAAILFLWYIYDKQAEHSDLRFDLVDIWEFIKEDYEIIKQDFEAIRDKVRKGKAHELSEGDTYFLGACTKAKNCTKTSSQPFCDIPAKRRAFCFKTQYMKYIYDNMVGRRAKRKSYKEEIFKAPNKTIEETILDKFGKYLGWSTVDLCREFEIQNHTKSTHSNIVRAILGAKGKDLKKTFKEFAAADIEVKLIRLDKNGKNKESMSFPAMDYCEIASQEWEDSSFYEYLTGKFIFPIFVYNKNKPNDYILDSVRVWNMPERDLDIVKDVWYDTKEKILNDDYEHFIKLKDKRIAHIRPHDRKAYYNTPTPQGDLQKKKSFWLNASYIYENIVCQDK